MSSYFEDPDKDLEIKIKKAYDKLCKNKDKIEQETTRRLTKREERSRRAKDEPKEESKEEPNKAESNKGRVYTSAEIVEMLGHLNDKINTGLLLNYDLYTKKKEKWERKAQQEAERKAEEEAKIKEAETKTIVNEQANEPTEIIPEFRNLYGHGFGTRFF